MSQKNIVISRKTVVDALKHEPLISGAFVRTKRDNHDKEPCGVCAVGSVLRTCGFKSNQIDDVADRFLNGPVVGTVRDLNKALSKGNWLNALSIKFERMASDLAKVLGKKNELLTPKETDILRKPLIEWVKNNLPTKLGEIKVTKTRVANTWTGKREVETDYSIVLEKKQKPKTLDTFDSMLG